jgi:hypothetical protein
MAHNNRNRCRWSAHQRVQSGITFLLGPALGKRLHGALASVSRPTVRAARKNK